MEDLVTVVSRLFAGGLIDLERAYTGRPAGLRTHFPGMHVFKSVDVTYSVSMGIVSKCAARHCASGSNTHGSRRDDRRWIFRGWCHHERKIHYSRIDDGIVNMDDRIHWYHPGNGILYEGFNCNRVDLK